MGHAMAARLLEGGHQVVVWTRSKGKARELVAAGATDADTVADVDCISPVLQSLSNTVRRYDWASLVGAAKLTSNLLLLAGVAALAEAFAVGIRPLGSRR